ncbi:CoA-substrate-specific enzyme activase, partial [Candidatus Magnetoovum chiemensis]
MNFLGLDAGSVSVKIAVMDTKTNIFNTYYERHKGHAVSTAYRLLKEIIKYDDFIYITGSCGKLIADILDIEQVNEITAQCAATKKLLPSVNTIIELGGEDSKLIILDEKNSLKDFSMNSVCAAGTGSFLDQQAERMRLTIEEFSEMAYNAQNVPRIAGRCSVFAKSDMIHLQQIATPVEDIVAGLCFAVARNFKGSIVKGRSLKEQISFHGGVSLNKGMIRAFKHVFGLDNLITPQYRAFMGCIGAVLKGIETNKEQKADISMLERYLNMVKSEKKGKKPLVSKGDGFYERHVPSSNHEEASINNSATSRNSQKIPAYMGIDIGSISTNLAVIDNNGSLLAKRYLMTASRPIEAVTKGLSEINEEIGDTIEIKGVGTTGSGRYMIADFVGADIVKNEITAQATAAIYIDKTVDTIFEIGGQDSKYISLEDGVIIDFEMNKACAAGTGSFLEEQAEKLSVSIKDEFSKYALCACTPSNLGERCTVFMENSLMSNLQKGAGMNDLLAGLAYSIVENYINRVVAGRKIGNKIFFQGGTAYNKSVVAAFEKFIGQNIIVPPNHDVTGAIGMALIAKDYIKAANGKGATRFKGFEISNRKYNVSSFECKGCSNLCEINRVKIEDETNNLFYGGRCEKYDMKKQDKPAASHQDLFDYREAILWSDYEGIKSNGKVRPKIGLPYIFLIHDY